MRPRVFPAEDHRRRRERLDGIEASMRPRVFPAEDELLLWRERQASHASMRPRVFPAEDIPEEFPTRMAVELQ